MLSFSSGIPSELCRLPCVCQQSNLGIFDASCPINSVYRPRDAVQLSDVTATGSKW